MKSRDLTRPFARRPVTLHDFGGGGFLLILFGIPLLIGLAVLVIIAITVRLIIKAYTKNQGEPNYRTGPTDGRDKPYATDKSGWTRKDV